MIEEAQQTDENIIFYKIMAGKRYRVYKTVNSFGKIFYKITCKQKDIKKGIFNTYTEVYFRRGCTPKDITDTGVDIIIKKAIENRRKNPRDPYHDISSLTILEYEIIEDKETKQAEAMDKFNQIQEENGDDSFDEYSKYMEVSDEDISF